MIDRLGLYELLRREVSGAGARALATGIWQTDRTMSFDRFAETAAFCAKEMRGAGLSAVRIERFPADGKARYGDLVMPKAWDCESATLVVHGDGKPASTVCDYEAEPLSIAQGCGKTPKAGIEGEVIYLPKGDLKGLSCRGKFLLTNDAHSSLVSKAETRGAVGIIWYDMPAWPHARREPWDNPDGRLWRRVEPAKKWLSFVLSPRQGEELKRRVQGAPEGKPVRARAKVRSRAYNGEIFAVTGLIPGETDREVVIIPHLFEPGANDNASGCGMALELARTIVRLVADGELPRPKLGIRLLLPMEFNTTLAFYETRPGIRKRTVAGIVPDMVGQDQPLCGSALICQVTPDAAPSFINALMLDTLGAVRGNIGRRRGRVDEPYGLAYDADYWGNDCFVSDPTVGIPTVGLIEWPDRFYHSSADTPDKLSEDTLARNAALTGAIAVQAATMDTERAKQTCHRIAARAVGDMEQLAVGLAEKLDDEGLRADLPARLAHLARREREAMETLLPIVPQRGRAGVRELIDRLGEDLREAAERIRARFAATDEPPRPRRTVARRRAESAVARRKLMGPAQLRDLDSATERKLGRLRKKGLPTHLLLWVDGVRTVSEVLERCRGEGAQAEAANVLAYLDLLTHLGYIEWVVQ